MTGAYSLALGGAASVTWSSGYTVGRKGTFSKDVHLRGVTFTPAGSGLAHATVYDSSNRAVATGANYTVPSGSPTYELPIDVVLTASTTYTIAVYFASGVKVATSGGGTYNSSPAFCSWTDSGSMLYSSGANAPTTAQAGYYLPITLGFDSTNSPPNTPTLTSPNGGDVVDAAYTVSCTSGGDLNNDPLTFDYDLSTDGGSTWANIITGGSTTQSFDFSAQPESTNCLVRVRAYDGQLYSAYDQSNAVFTIQHTNVSYFDGASWTAVPRYVYDGTSWVKHNPQVF